MQKKVLICMPSLGICNGITTFIMAFYDYLIQHEYKIDFLLISDQHLEIKPYVVEKGSKVFSIPLGKKYDRKRINYINSVMCKGNYDIVHVNVPGPNGALVLKMAKKNGVKYRVYHCHNPFNTLNIKTILSDGVYTQLCRKRANRYLACSKKAGKSIFGKKPFTVINNAINPEEFVYDVEARKKIRKGLNLQNQLVIGVAARIEEQKNPTFIIEVFSEIKKIRKDAVLIWVGSGSKQMQIEDLCEKKEIKNSVLLVGRQSNVADWYSAMDIFLLPSKFEGLGIAYLEAQANGLLCFGSDKVPEETEITDLMARLSLNERARTWASIILNSYDNLKEKHCVNIDLFQKRGFDIRYIQERLYQIYESYEEVL